MTAKIEDGFYVRKKYYKLGQMIDLEKYFEIWINTEQYVWFGLVLWHINLCRLFNAKSIFMWITISNNSV